MVRSANQKASHLQAQRDRRAITVGKHTSQEVAKGTLDKYLKQTGLK